MTHTGSTKIHYATVAFFGLLLLPAAGCRPAGVHAGFLTAWSADGNLCAIVPFDDENENRSEAELWILDAQANKAERILKLGAGEHCLQPRWSPDGGELVFALIGEDAQEKEHGHEEIPFSVWITGRHGENLRKLAQSRAPESLLEEGNAVSWGPLPRSILYPAAVEGKVTAVHLNLETGMPVPFLPRPADAYSISVSPAGDRVICLLYDAEKQLADIHMGDFAAGSWQFLGSAPSAKDAFESSNGPVFWSPGGKDVLILVAGKDESGADRVDARIYESGSGSLRNIALGTPNSSLVWNDSGSAFAFSECPGDDGGDTPVYRVDALTGNARALVLKGENHLLSWRGDLIYFLRTYKEESGTSEPLYIHRLFSVDAGGDNIREIGTLLPQGSWGWNPSPDGRYMLLLTDSYSAQVLDLATGEIGAPLFFDR